MTGSFHFAALLRFDSFRTLKGICQTKICLTRKFQTVRLGQLKHWRVAPIVKLTATVTRVVGAAPEEDEPVSGGAP
jgi:hypothetical protein